MKQITIFLILIISIGCKAQVSNQIEFTYDDFEKEIITYKPKQNSNVSKKDFDYGLMILNETKSGVENNPENFNLGDYFNVLSLFLTLRESESNINIAFEKFKNADGSCEYFLAFENIVNETEKYSIIREKYNMYLSKCKSNPKVDIKFNITEYSKKHNLNLSLIETINNINIRDQKYRNKQSKDLIIKQKTIDKQNQESIDSLFNIHKTYIGRKLVGEKFEVVMWAVIQHSNPEMMERYLPIIQTSVENKELSIGPFKMLIDRFYGLKYGYQIFGSQSGFGFDMADDKTREKIKIKYGIE